MTTLCTRPRAYFAAPLFNEAERQFNQQVVRRLERQIDVFLPQRDGGLLLDKIKAGTSPEAAERSVFSIDIEAMRKADFLIAVLDGSSIDEGVAFEIGYMYCLSRPCVGLQTDVRRSLPTGNNPMISAALREVFVSVGALDAGLSTLNLLDRRARPLWDDVRTHAQAAM